ncbi:MAG: ferrous iron transport protein A [Bacteroidales bacterium]|nr:ferrous iron transport protein A [Bacteroidales bacterium]
MSKEKRQTSLINLEDGETGIIISILGGERATKRLADLGLKKGTEIRIIRRTLFRGPVQIEACGSKLVLGRGLASKILVEQR